MLLTLIGASCAKHNTMTMNDAHTTEMIPMGTEYLPRLKSDGTNEVLLTVTLRRMGIKYDVYRPVAVRENRAPSTVGFVSPGIPVIEE